MKRKTQNAKRKTETVADNVSAHITKVGGNVFADLDFGAVEAKALQVQTREVIEKKLCIKSS